MIKLALLVITIAIFVIPVTSDNGCFYCEGPLEECRKNSPDEFRSCPMLGVCYVTHHADTSVSMGCTRFEQCTNGTLSCAYGEEECNWCCHQSRCNLPFLYPPYVPIPTVPITFPTSTTSDPISGSGEPPGSGDLSGSGEPSGSGELSGSGEQSGSGDDSGSGEPPNTPMECYKCQGNTCEVDKERMLCSPNEICFLRYNEWETNMGCIQNDTCQSWRWGNDDCIPGSLEDGCVYCCSHYDGCNNIFQPYFPTTKLPATSTSVLSSTTSISTPEPPTTNAGSKSSTIGSTKSTTVRSTASRTKVPSTSTTEQVTSSIGPSSTTEGTTTTTLRSTKGPSTSTMEQVTTTSGSTSSTAAGTSSSTTRPISKTSSEPSTSTTEQVTSSISPSSTTGSTTGLTTRTTLGETSTSTTKSSTPGYSTSPKTQMECYKCQGNTCEVDKERMLCSPNEICFLRYNEWETNMGCIQNDTCQSWRWGNDDCIPGSLEDGCVYCCSHYDGCNNIFQPYFPTTKLPATSTSVLSSTTSISTPEPPTTNAGSKSSTIGSTKSTTVRSTTSTTKVPSTSTTEQVTTTSGSTSSTAAGTSSSTTRPISKTSSEPSTSTTEQVTSSISPSSTTGSTTGLTTRTTLGETSTSTTKSSTPGYSTSPKTQMECYKCQGNTCEVDKERMLCSPNEICFLRYNEWETNMGCIQNDTCQSWRWGKDDCIPGSLEDGCVYCCSHYDGCNNIFQPYFPTTKLPATSTSVLSSTTSISTPEPPTTNAGSKSSTIGSTKSTTVRSTASTTKVTSTSTTEQVTSSIGLSSTTEGTTTTTLRSTKGPSTSTTEQVTTTSGSTISTAAGTSSSTTRPISKASSEPSTSITEQVTSSISPSSTTEETKSTTLRSTDSTTKEPSTSTSDKLSPTAKTSSYFTLSSKPDSTKFSTSLEGTSTTSSTIRTTTTYFPGWNSTLFPSDTTLTTTPANNRTDLRCYDCNGSVEHCIGNATLIDCNDVCMTGIGRNGLVEMGCIVEEVCKGTVEIIGECQQGVHNETCAYCCDSPDGCNKDILYPRPPANQCELVNYSICLYQWADKISNTIDDPTFHFAEFCRGVPDIAGCLLKASEDCCEENREYLRPRYEEILRNMTDMCPESCSEEKATECLRSYYEEVLDIIIGGGTCGAVFRLSEDKLRCVNMAMATCTPDVRELYNKTYWTIRRAAEANCDNLSPCSIANVTDSCSPEYARKCISIFGGDILDYLLNGTSLLEEICQRIEGVQMCYQELTETCDEECRESFEAGFNFTSDLIVEECDLLEVPICEAETARECILHLWEIVDVAEDFQTACNLINATKICVEEHIEGCDESEKRSLRRSLELVIEMIGDRCEDVILCPVDKEITLIEGGDSKVINFNIMRSPSDICGGNPDCTVYIDVDLDLADFPKCRNGRIISQAVVGDWTNDGDALCSLRISEDNWHSPQYIPITAKLDFKFDGDQHRKLVIWQRTIIEGRIERRSLCEILVIIRDRDHPAQCSSINDPHTTTFDGHYFNNFLEGHFIMYRHRDLPYEVQIISQRCNHRATCNCGVSVKVGDTVLFLDRCRRKSDNRCRGNRECAGVMRVDLMTGSGTVTPGTVIMRRNDGRRWEVIMPHGTFVRVATNGDFLNVWITPSPIDWENSLGKCGYFNGDRSDDMRMRDGTLYTGPGRGVGDQPNPYSNEWRARPQERTYRGVATAPFIPQNWCDCRTNDTGGNICGPNGILELCDFDIDGEVGLFSADALSIHKRSVRNEFVGSYSMGRNLMQQSGSEIDFDLDEDWIAPPIDDSNFPSKEAYAICRKAFDEIEFLQKCEDGVVKMEQDMKSCIEDVQITGDTRWIASQIESFREKCTEIINRDTRFSDPSDPAFERANAIQRISCPNECSFHGDCAKGVCTCHDGFTGIDCGFNKSSEIDDTFIVNKGLCNTRERTCEAAPVGGFGFIPGTTRCYLQKAEVTDQVDTLSTEVHAPLAIIETPNLVSCPLPDIDSYYVQVSNDDGKTRTEPELFIPRDHICWSCNASEAVCARSMEGCLIPMSSDVNGCFRAQEINPSDESGCYVCDPSKNPDDWTYVCSTFPLMAIIVPVVVFVIIMLGLVIVAIKKYRRNKANQEKTEWADNTCYETSSTFRPDLQHSGYDTKSQDPAQIHPIDGMDIEQGSSGALPVVPYDLSPPAEASPAEENTSNTSQQELADGTSSWRL